MNLIYPTLDLFLYDLREGLRQTPDQISRHRQYFWSRVYDTLSPDKLQELTRREDLMRLTVELLRSTPAANGTQPFDPPHDGYVYPLQLEDTYALQINYSGHQIPDSKTTPQPLTLLPKLKAEIETRIKQQWGSIGQTWLLTAQLADPDTSLEQITEIAKACYGQLLPDTWLENWEVDLEGTGHLFGGSLYEIWRYPDPWEDLNTNYHLLILLLPYERSLNTFGDTLGKAYTDLIRLFCYRNKILWSYSQSQQLNSSLKKQLTQLQETLKLVTQPSQPLSSNELQNHLQTTLKTLSTYALDLNDLDNQRQTITVNLTNYTQQLQDLSPQDPAADLTPLHRLITHTQVKLLPQVQTDHANLSPGLTLLENLITSLDGLTQINQSNWSQQEAGLIENGSSSSPSFPSFSSFLWVGRPTTHR